MRLCVDARLYHASGIGTFLRGLLPLLAKEFDLLVLRSCAKELPLDTTQIALKSGIYTIKEQIELCRKIPGADLFWSPHYNIPLLPIRARRRLVTIHDVYPLAFSHTLPLHQKLYAKMVMNAALNFSDCVCTVSQFTKEEITKHCNFKGRIEVIYNFTPPHFKEGATLPRSYFLAVGNLKPHKNLLRLVKAFASMKCKEKLFLVGTAEKLRTVDNELMEFVENHLKERVIFTGFVSDEQLARYYAGAKLFLFPSYYEGFGFPPLEAMASLCPVVAARSASIPEICKEAVYYVDPYDIASIREGMETVLQNEPLRVELIARGKERASQLTLEKTAESYIRLIRSL